MVLAVRDGLEPDDPAWPALPGRMRGAELRQLAERMGTDPVFTRGFAGVSFSRLREVLPPEQRALARLLGVWFDRAGLLEEPPREVARFQSVRRLRTAELAAIAAQLRATAVPTDAEVAEMIARSAGGGTP